MRITRQKGRAEIKIRKVGSKRNEVRHSDDGDE